MRSKRAAVPGGRNVPIFVRVTPEEAAALQGMRVELGARSLQQVLLWCAFEMPRGGDSPGERRRWAGELHEVRRVLSGVANNLNQATKALNQLARQARVEDRLPVVEFRELLVELRKPLPQLEVLSGPDGRIDAVVAGFAREGMAS